MEYIGGRMRLIPPESTRQAHVAKILGDVIIECFHFVHIRGPSFGKFGSLGANLSSRLPPLVIETCIPSADLFPSMERRELHGGNFILGLFLLLFLLIFVLLLIVLALQ